MCTLCSLGSGSIIKWTRHPFLFIIFVWIVAVAVIVSSNVVDALFSMIMIITITLSNTIPHSFRGIIVTLSGIQCDVRRRLLFVLMRCVFVGRVGNLIVRQMTLKSEPAISLRFPWAYVHLRPAILAMELTAKYVKKHYFVKEDFLIT